MGSKRFFMLAMATVLLLGLSSAAFAQSRFVVSSSPLQQRQTGVTETVGDLLLTSSDPSPSPTIPAGTNLTVSIIPAAATITNDPTLNGTNLVIETPPGFAPMPVPGATLAVGTGPLSNTLIISFGATVPVPLNTRLRIRGIRVNDQASGLTFPAQIQAQLNVTPPDVMRFDNVSTVAVSTPLPTLGISFPQPSGQLFQCLGGAQGTLVRRIVLTEQFSAVFTSLDQEIDVSDTPLPTNPTRIEVILRGVPGGLTVTPPRSADLITTPPVSPADAQLVLNTRLSQTARLSSARTRDIMLTYDVTGTPDLGQIEHTPSLAASDAPFAGFDFTFRTSGSISTQALGNVTLQVHLAPVSASTARAISGPCPGTAPSCIIPRFTDPLVPVMPPNLFGVVACNCHLKFPFVTNQAGFDTGIAIANTTRDPYGTAGQSGTITLFFFGMGAPTPPRRNITRAVAAGSTFAQTLSSLAPRFQSYVIAVANFQFCEGFAFIADRAFANIAHGYVAMVIPDPVQVGTLLGSSTQQRIPGFVTTGTLSVTINPMTGAGSGTVTIRDALGERLLQ